MYTEFYGLTAEPFLLTPDARFYFDSSVHSQAMAHLQYGIQRGEGFIVITGEVGAGKTTIVQHLCSTVDSHKIVPAHIVTTLLNGAELIRMTCAAFGLRDVPESKDGAILRLRRHIEELYAGDRRPLIIVDEAQNLSASALEELRMLSNFQVGNTSPCQIFLIGQPQFRQIIADPNLEQLRQRIIASYHLGPLGRDDCAHYLSHRLNLVGWKEDPTFRPDAVDAIFRHTDGVPRRINTLCSRLLLFGLLDDIHAFSAYDVDRVAADLREETQPRSALTSRANDMEDTYISRVDNTNLPRRLATAEARLDVHERSIRHLFTGMAKIVDPAWLPRKP